MKILRRWVTSAIVIMVDTTIIKNKKQDEITMKISVNLVMVGGRTI